MLKRPAAVAIATTLLAVPLLAGCGSSSPSAASSTTPSGTATSGTCSYNASGAAAKPVNAPGSTPDTSITRATLSTNRGTIGITLDPKDTPCTVNSFVSLIKQGYYNNTPCHRLTTSGIYVLQCGDPSGTGTGGPGYAFADELVPAAQPKSCDSFGQCIYPAGTVAMAHTSMPSSNGSQFFLVYQDSPLPYQYTIFGQMSADGLKTVQAIAAHGSAAPDATGNTAPNESVTITSATAGVS